MAAENNMILEMKFVTKPYLLHIQGASFIFDTCKYKKTSEGFSFYFETFKFNTDNN